VSNLLSTLISSTNALRAFDQALNVVQNNVSNVSTPGYARQEQPLSAERFLPEEGLAGGVRAGDLISRRSDYAERAVRAQQSALGFSEQRRADLEQVEPLFAPIENAGIPGALSKFFQAFSQVGVNPNSATVRQVILDRADAVAKSFRDTATGLQSAQSETDRQIRGTVEEINGLLARIRDFNIGMRSNADASVDAGLDANLHQTLEQLSGLVDFQALEAPDRSLTILIGGSELAVIGDHDFPVGTDFTNAAVKITNAAGADMTSSIKESSER
jgi:flagellar hook-associated protein 1 FlgK